MVVLLVYSSSPWHFIHLHTLPWFCCLALLRSAQSTYLAELEIDELLISFQLQIVVAINILVRGSEESGFKEPELELFAAYRGSRGSKVFVPPMRFGAYSHCTLEGEKLPLYVCAEACSTCSVDCCSSHDSHTMTPYHQADYPRGKFSKRRTGFAYLNLSKISKSDFK